jgi:hypothetical protein
VTTVEEKQAWQVQKVFNMFHSRLNMFNIGFLAVVTLEQPDQEEKDAE